MRIQELDTPAVIVDLDILENNIARLSRYARDHGLHLRPHVKTHKIPAISKMQNAALKCRRMSYTGSTCQLGCRNSKA